MEFVSVSPVSAQFGLSGYRASLDSLVNIATALGLRVRVDLDAA